MYSTSLATSICDIIRITNSLNPLFTKDLTKNKISNLYNKEGDIKRHLNSSINKLLSLNKLRKILGSSNSLL